MIQSLIHFIMYIRFKSFNYLIPAHLALKIRLSEAFTGYGHEDTHYGQLLKEANIPILHLDNPLYHIGLDNRNSILKKNQEAQHNLLIIKKIVLWSFINMNQFLR